LPRPSLPPLPPPKLQHWIGQYLPPCRQSGVP
jgi:hypothetical protein